MWHTKNESRIFLLNALQPLAKTKMTRKSIFAHILESIQLSHMDPIPILIQLIVFYKKFWCSIFWNISIRNILILIFFSCSNKNVTSKLDDCVCFSFFFSNVNKFFFNNFGFFKHTFFLSHISRLTTSKRESSTH